MNQPKSKNFVAIPQAEIAKAKSVSLLGVAQKLGVELEPVGGDRWKAICPFHQEKTGSFYVFSDNRWHCFGCNQSGDVVDFYRKFTGRSFREAVVDLRNAVAGSNSIKAGNYSIIDVNNLNNELQPIKKFIECTNDLQLLFGRRLWDNWQRYKAGQVEPVHFWTRDHTIEHVLYNFDQGAASALHLIASAQRRWKIERHSTC